MTNVDIARRRLANQLLAHPEPWRPDEAVRWFGAVQAQEYFEALWAIGLRIPGAVEADIERSIAERRIVRTWPMRGTIHFVPAEDAKWMLELLTPRVVSRFAGRHCELGLDEKTFDHGKRIIHEALQGGRAMTRKDLRTLLDSEGVSTSGQRGYHILVYLSHKGFICFGPREGRQQTFVLLDEWVPEHRALDCGEALAELAGRYFRSHGPATIHDFAWWSGLTIADAKAALEAIRQRLVREEIDGQTYWLSESAANIESPAVHLLPAFDEYAVAYKDRGAILDPSHHSETDHGLTRAIVLDGRIIGAWKPKLEKDRVVVALNLLEPIGQAEQDALVEAAHRYGTFLGKRIEVTE